MANWLHLATCTDVQCEAMIAETVCLDILSRTKELAVLFCCVWPWKVEGVWDSGGPSSLEIWKRKRSCRLSSQLDLEP